MPDTHPASFTIEIDRPNLGRYFCVRSLVLLFIYFSASGVAAGMVGVQPAIHHGTFTRRLHVFQHLLECVTWGVGLSIVAFLAFYLFVHRPASLKAAAMLEVTVEGAFLRIKTHNFIRIDRKLHFRSIVDYTVSEDSLMRRFGITALELTTIRGERIFIPGVKDCLVVRDLLIETDRQREHL